MGTYLRLWDTFFELERIQHRELYVSPEKPFERYCNQYIQGVTGGTDQISGGCSLCYTIPI